MKGETRVVSPFLFSSSMGESKYYHPAMEARLAAYFEAMDWQGLAAYLDGLSNKDFRMAGNILGERLMPRVEAHVFWGAFHALLACHSKAFLGTMLKAAALRKQVAGFTLRHGGFLLVAGFLNGQGTEVDRAKFVCAMLAIFSEEVEELEYMFNCLQVDSGRGRMEILLHGQGTACAYLLFQSMRQVEHDRDLLARCCRVLMKRGDALSFNLASVAKVYFDLPQVKGTFSLSLSPFQLGWLETSFENFKKVMQGI